MDENLPAPPPRGNPASPGTPPELKKCPSCAETVKAEALICRFCGYDFRTGSVQPRTGMQLPTPPTSQVIVQEQKTNGLAVASLVLGIVWLYWIGSILALVFGYRAKNQIDRSGGREGGRGLAVAGIVLGWVGMAFLGLMLLFVAVASNSST